MILTPLYRAAGADDQLMSRCTHSDQIKYACMGTLILILSVLSFAVMGYVLFDIALQSNNTFDDLTVLLISFIWMLIVHNMYRLIIASAGYGDGTFHIRGQELLNVFVPWVMAVLLGVCFAGVLAVLLVQGDLQMYDANELQLSFFNQLKKVWEIAPYGLVVTIPFGVFLYSLPIILKLVFWRKAPYEYQVEFQDILTLAKYGVVPKADKFPHKGKVYYKPRYLQAEQLLQAELGHNK